MSESRGDLWTTSLPAASFPTASPRVGRARHAVPVARRPAAAHAARRGWLLAATLAVMVSALLFGVVRGSAGRAGTDAATIPAVPTAVIPGAGAAAAPTAPVVGSLTAGSTSVFDAAQAGDRGLVALAGDTAAGHAVPVQSVPADEGFWVGTSETDRVWVQLTTNGESSLTIMAGQLLDLRGPVVPHGADFAGKAGVSAADGAAQLTREGAHLEVDPTQVKVVGTPSPVPPTQAMGTASQP